MFYTEGVNVLPPLQAHGGTAGILESRNKIEQFHVLLLPNSLLQQIHTDSFLIHLNPDNIGTDGFGGNNSADKGWAFDKDGVAGVDEY